MASSTGDSSTEPGLSVKSCDANGAALAGVTYASLDAHKVAHQPFGWSRYKIYSASDAAPRLFVDPVRRGPNELDLALRETERRRALSIILSVTL